MQEKLKQEIEALKRLIQTNNEENSSLYISKTNSNEKLYTSVSLELLNYLLTSLEKYQDESFKLKLEKTIWKYVPIDFADAWTVAMAEVKQMDDKKGDEESINLNHLVKNIKKEHPNLFLNIDDFLPSEFQKIN